MVPFWTNIKKLEPSDELIGDAIPLPKKAPRAATWRDDAKQDERDAAKAAEEAAAPPKKVIRKGFDALDVEADNV